MSLTSERCVACRPDSPRLTEAEIAELMPQIPEWELTEERGVPRLRRTFRFPSYMDGIAFVQRVGALADREDHHPRMIVDYARVTVVWWTHAIGGLHRNDFIAAAKTDQAAN